MTSKLNVSLTVEQAERREIIGGVSELTLENESEKGDVITVGTTEETYEFASDAVPVGLIYARNLDPTNWVQVAKRKGDTPFSRLHPVAQDGAPGGPQNLIPPLHPDVTGLALKANSANCLVLLRAFRRRNDAVGDFGWGKWSSSIQAIFDTKLTQRVLEDDLSVAETNDDVRKWLDYSHQGNHAEQTTVANQATLENDGDGDPTLVFDGTNDTYPLYAPAGVAGRTTFWVLTTPASFAAQHTVLRDVFTGPTVRHDLAFLITSGNLQLTARRVSGDSGVNAAKTGVTVDTKYVIVTRVNYATGAVQVYLGGGSPGTATIGTTGNSDAGNTQELSQSDANQFGGKVSFFADMNAALSDADVNEIANFLNTRYSSPGWTDI